MSGGSPFQQAGSAANDYTKLLFVFQQLMRGVATATLVRVNACTNDGALSPVGFVDVTPMVHQVDGMGQPVPHDTIYDLPYNRLQGGVNAIIMDPKKGDIGVAVFASRDISSVKANKAPSNPASARVFDYSDGMYFGGFINGPPTNFVQFQDNGTIVIHSNVKVQVTAPEIDLVSPGTINVSAGTAVNITAPAIKLDGIVTTTDDVTVGGGLAVTGTTTGTGAASFIGGVTGQGTNLHTHTHPPGSYVAGATPVTGNSAPP